MDPDPDRYLLLTDLDPGGPKIFRSGSATLVKTEVGTTPDPFRKVKLYRIMYLRAILTVSKLEFVGFSFIKETGSRARPHFEFKDAYLMSYLYCPSLAWFW
jgi:hypothetical protein